MINRPNYYHFVLALSAALFALALFFPARTFVEALLGSDSLRIPYLLTGTLILRFTLMAEALLLLVSVFGQAWFRSAGLPVSATGLTLGPEGWPTAQARPSWFLLGGLLFLAVVLRFIGLNQDLWLDEIATLTLYARLPFLQNFIAFNSANQHMLYSALASLSLSLFGESAWAVRLPAALFGVGGVAALYYLARVLTSEHEAVWATALLAVAYHHIWFSQNARGWSGLLFFALLGSGLFLRGLAQNQPWIWPAYAIVMTLGILIHLNTVFVFLGHFASYIWVLPTWSGWLRQHWPLTRRLGWSGLVVVVLILQAYSLILPEMVAYARTEDRTGLGWTKSVTQRGQDLPLRDGLALESSTFVQYFTTSPHPREGIRAFKEKRQPEF